MSTLRKVRTSLSLLARGDFAGFSGHFVLNLRRLRVALSRGEPFIHRRLGLPFPCFPNRPESLELFLQGGADAFELTLMREWMEAGDTSIDVGANLGIYACIAAHSVGKSGLVMAVEASPVLAEQIAETARVLAFDNVHVCQACAGDFAGETEFYVASTEPSTGKQSIHVERGAEAGYTKILVKIDTLDHLWPAPLQGKPPTFVKMDIEGAEVSALRGAGTLVAMEDAAFWIVEINPSALKRFGFVETDVPKFFPPARFERWLIPQHHPSGPPMIPRPLVDTERFEDATFYNLIALPIAGQWMRRSSRIRDKLRVL
jgi:FkbM family methyltransferase